MLVLATILSVVVLIQAGSHPAQLHFHTAQERIITQYSPATNSNLSRELSAP